jgi:hypothetical protein
MPLFIVDYRGEERLLNQYGLSTQEIFDAAMRTIFNVINFRIECYIEGGPWVPVSSMSQVQNLLERAGAPKVIFIKLYDIEVAAIEVAAIEVAAIEVAAIEVAAIEVAVSSET